MINTALMNLWALAVGFILGVGVTCFVFYCVGVASRR